ncbi:hypothetical protein BN12_1590001 [Nostocoides japonicum T1-X7]|uniref:Uncharacterized protein n=1 Tax=Nostocoides japonicum T1-X7 TaxID=1194083 RepID=A0A077LYG5_9MICO|nr:hypothetical protein BN12_1590001 [Tetrasphaera japonica T1-X7]
MADLLEQLIALRRALTS